MSVILVPITVKLVLIYVELAPIFVILAPIFFEICALGNKTWIISGAKPQQLPFQLMVPLPYNRLHSDEPHQR